MNNTNDVFKAEHKLTLCAEGVSCKGS